MVAQSLGCPTGPCVTGRWLMLQDMAAGEGAVPPITSIQGWRPRIGLVDEQRGNSKPRGMRCSWKRVLLSKEDAALCTN